MQSANTKAVSRWLQHKEKPNLRVNITHNDDVADNNVQGRTFGSNLLHSIGRLRLHTWWPTSPRQTRNHNRNQLATARYCHLHCSSLGGGWCSRMRQLEQHGNQVHARGSHPTLLQTFQPLASNSAGPSNLRFQKTSQLAHATRGPKNLNVRKDSGSRWQQLSRGT
jgi:hypothetical protein